MAALGACERLAQSEHALGGLPPSTTAVLPIGATPWAGFPPFVSVPLAAADVPSACIRMDRLAMHVHVRMLA